jgi:serine/threonine protein kinase
MLLDEYTLTQFLGKGTFGEVYLTTKKNSDFLFATKRMSKDFVEDPKYIKYFNNEISILNKLFHKNIVKLEALKKTKNHYYVIMEYCNGGTLTECLEKYKNLYHRPFTEEIVQHIMRQVVSAVNYMHDLRIIHRDLKLDNILVKFENEEDKNNLNLLKAEVKIIDFGFAAYKDQSGLLKTAIGSPMNMDPLILQKFNSGGKLNKELGYDEKADIWSLGTLCYQMLIGNSAFDAYNMKELVSKVEEGTYKVPSDLSKETVSFLNAMLQYDPNRRLSANELNKHAFIIKNVNDFTRINTNLIPKKKIFGGEIEINIKENLTIWSIFNEDDEKKLMSIPGAIFATETPISESQYLDNLNPVGEKNALLINSEPINLEKNFIEKEFKPANSTPIPGVELGGKPKSTPIPEMNKGIINNNNFNIKGLNNIANNNPINEEMNTIPKQPILSGINLTNNNIYVQNNGNNTLTLIRKLENGQIITTQMTIEQYKKQLQQQQQRLNAQLVNKFQPNQVNPVVPNGIPPHQQIQQQPQINKVRTNPIRPMPFSNQNQLNQFQPIMQIPNNNQIINNMNPQNIIRRNSAQAQIPQMGQIIPQINQYQNPIHQQASPYKVNKIQKQISQPIQNNQIKNNAQMNQQNSPRIIIKHHQNSPSNLPQNPNNQYQPKLIQPNNQFQKTLPQNQIKQEKQILQYGQFKRLPINQIQQRIQTPLQTQKIFPTQKALISPNKNIQNNHNQIKIPPQGPINSNSKTPIKSRINQIPLQGIQRLNTEHNFNLNNHIFNNRNQIFNPRNINYQKDNSQNVKIINNNNLNKDKTHTFSNRINADSQNINAKKIGHIRIQPQQRAGASPDIQRMLVRPNLNSAQRNYVRVNKF